MFAAGLKKQQIGRMTLLKYEHKRKLKLYKLKLYKKFLDYASHQPVNITAEIIYPDSCCQPGYRYKE
jgi:hypothetical protein